MATTYKTNSDGSITKTQNGKNYTVTKNDSRYGRVSGEASSYYKSSGGGGSSSGGGGNPYSGYSNSQINNQKNYLLGLMNTGNAGQKSWANQEYSKLSNAIDQRIGNIIGGAGGGYGSQRDFMLVGNAGRTAPTGFEDYNKLLEEARRAEEEAKRKAIEDGVNKLSAQIPGLNQSYDDMARQSYINYRMGQRDTMKGLDRLGLASGGMAESTLADTSNRYQNTLSQGEQARQNALNTVNRDITSLRSTGNLSIAEGAASYNKMLADAYQQMLANQQTQSNWQAELDFNKSQSEAAKQSAIYNQLLSLGIVTPDVQSYYGITQDRLNKALYPDIYGMGR